MSKINRSSIAVAIALIAGLTTTAVPANAAETTCGSTKQFFTTNASLTVKNLQIKNLTGAVKAYTPRCTIYVMSNSLGNAVVQFDDPITYHGMSVVLSKISYKEARTIVKANRSK
jgi:hypothetical protein